MCSIIPKNMPLYAIHPSYSLPSKYMSMNYILTEIFSILNEILMKSHNCDDVVVVVVVTVMMLGLVLKSRCSRECLLLKSYRGTFFVIRIKFLKFIISLKCNLYYTVFII